MKKLNNSNNLKSKQMNTTNTIAQKANDYISSIEELFEIIKASEEDVFFFLCFISESLNVDCGEIIKNK